MLHVWRFSYYGSQTEEDVDIEKEKNTRAYELMEKCNNGEKIDDIDKVWICKESMNSTCVRNQICRNGWAYDFRPFMKRYVFHYNGTWIDGFAFNKTTLRKAMYGRIDEISELKNKHKEN